MAIADDAEAAAQARDQIEDQTRLVYAAALAWIVLHDETEEPAEDSTLARAAKTLALLMLRAARRAVSTPVPLPTGEDRHAWIRSTAREVTARAVADSRTHASTVFKRMKAKDPKVSTRVVQTAVADDIAWSDAAARTRATRLASESTLRVHADVERITGEPHSKMWISRGDPKVRKTHRRLHGKVEEVGDEFHTVAGHSLRFPGDPEAPLDEIINCRCALFLVPTAEKAKAEEVFSASDEDFDVPVAASASMRAWAREQAKRDWLYELGLAK